MKRQSGMGRAKFDQLEQAALKLKPDIILLQEVHFMCDTLDNQNFITNSYQVIHNNALNGYGTAALVRFDLHPTQIRKDDEGRVLCFEVADLTHLLVDPSVRPIDFFLTFFSKSDFPLFLFSDFSLF